MRLRCIHSPWMNMACRSISFITNNNIGIDIVKAKGAAAAAAVAKPEEENKYQ